MLTVFLWNYSQEEEDRNEWENPGRRTHSNCQWKDRIDAQSQTQAKQEFQDKFFAPTDTHALEGQSRGSDFRTDRIPFK